MPYSVPYPAEMLDKFVDDHGNQWDMELEAFLFGYHATTRPDYGFSPFYIMYSRHSNGTFAAAGPPNDWFCCDNLIFRYLKCPGPCACIGM